MKYPLTLIDFHNDWARLVGKAANSYDLLTPEERIWYNVQALIDAINNGGIIGYYYNPGANHLWETIEDLKTICAFDIIDILDQMNKLFPNKAPSLNLEERNKIMSAWNDAAIWEALDDWDMSFYRRSPSLENTLMEHILAKRLIAAS